MRLLWVGLLLCGCGAGGVKYDSRTSVGQGCSDLGDALCTRVIECGWAPAAQRQECRVGFEGGCCADQRRCGALLTNPSGAASCVNRIPTEQCAAFGSITMPNLPAYCRQMF